MHPSLPTRSNGLIVSVLAALGFGTFCLFALPLVSADDGSDGDEFKYRALNYVMYFDEKDWLIDLGKIGVVMAAMAALAFTTSEREVQGLFISVGALAPVASGIWLYQQIEEEDGASLGIGMILAMIAYVVAAVIPWVAAANAHEVADRGQPTWMAGAQPGSQSLALQPASGHPGQSIEARWQGFGSGTFIDLRWIGADGTTMALGRPWGSTPQAPSFRFVIPADAAPGEARVMASQSLAQGASRRAEAKLLVTAPSVAAAAGPQPPAPAS